jgi:hypothetical protein
MSALCALSIGTSWPQFLAISYIRHRPDVSGILDLFIFQHAVELHIVGEPEPTGRLPIPGIQQRVWLCPRFCKVNGSPISEITQPEVPNVDSELVECLDPGQDSSQFLRLDTRVIRGEVLHDGSNSETTNCVLLIFGVQVVETQIKISVLEEASFVGVA